MADGNRREGIRSELREMIVEQLQERSHMEDEELYEQIDGAISRKGREIFLSLKERLWLRNSLYDSFRRLDILQELLDDNEVTEIMVNGAGKVFLERGGKTVLWDRRFDRPEQLEDIIQQIVGRVNRVVNVSSPIADARLEDGSRVHIVLPPVALDGPAVTIRKFPEPITMEKLIRLEAITAEAAGFMERLVEARYNIFVSGGTNSGKTTFLNALSSFIPHRERVITIEDSAELKLAHIENLVRLETRNANGEGQGAIGIGMLIRAALRMRPDRIVIGEVRGQEAVDLLQAMNTGHDGSFCTGHANSCRDMLARLETMVLMGMELPLPAIRSQIASALDVMVHVARMRDRSRKVTAIEEVVGIENGEIVLRPLFSLDGEGELRKAGDLRCQEKLRRAGYGL